VNRAAVRVAIRRFGATLRRRWGGYRATSTRLVSAGSVDVHGNGITAVPDPEPGASRANAVAALPGRMAARRLTALVLGAE